MAEFIELDPGALSLNQLRFALRLSQWAWRFSQTEQAIQFRENSYATQPDVPIFVKLGVETILELFDDGVAVLPGFL